MILTITKIQHYPTSKDGINFEEVPYLWYSEDFKPVKNNIKKF